MSQPRPVPNQQPRQPQPKAAAGQMSKLKKIEWYAGHLVNEAISKEKAGRTGDAIVDYLQAADLLLLLAKGQQDYTPWKTFSDSAVSCQQRAKALIVARKLQNDSDSATASAITKEKSLDSTKV